MVEKPARSFRLTVHNFCLKEYICLYGYNKWLNLLNFDSVSLDQLYIFFKQWKHNNLTT